MKSKIIIENMHCSNCVLTLEGLEDELAGIQAITANYRKQQIDVQFNPDIIKMTEIIKAINNKGYQVKSYSIA